MAVEAQELLVLAGGWIGDYTERPIIDMFAEGFEQLTLNAPEIPPVSFGYITHSLTVKNVVPTCASLKVQTTDARANLLFKSGAIKKSGSATCSVWHCDNRSL